MLLAIERSKNKKWNISDLEDCVRQSKAKKEKQVEMLLCFYQYCEEHLSIKIDSDLPDKIVIDDPLQRRLAIVKYMQNHKNTTAEIADVFMLDDRTLRTDLRSLEEGIRVFDKELKFDICHDKWKHCMECSSHPILLNLDMPEVVAITIGLAEVAKRETLFSAQFEKIASEIYSSLTEYAKGRILRLMKEKNLSFKSSEADMYEETNSNSLITMWKSGCSGTIQVCHDGVDYVYALCNVIDYFDKTIRIATENGKEIEILLTDIFCCEYELSREYD